VKLNVWPNTTLKKASLLISSRVEQCFSNGGPRPSGGPPGCFGWAALILTKIASQARIVKKKIIKFEFSQQFEIFLFICQNFMWVFLRNVFYIKFHHPRKLMFYKQHSSCQSNYKCVSRMNVLDAKSYYNVKLFKNELMTITLNGWFHQHSW
jgi:hypothetical protein